MRMTTQSEHIWKFSRVGGVNRVNLEKADDLKNLKNLDKKLWTALSCPVKGLEIDEKTLQLIDNNEDGRIRVEEIIEATTWAYSLLKNPEVLLSPTDSIELSNINTDTAEGKQMLASAQQILKNLGKANEKSICITDSSDTEAIFAKTQFNGDGIITNTSADDENLQKIIDYITENIGKEKDRSGADGVNKELIEQFYETCQSYSNWVEQGENDTSIFPFADKTQSALDIFNTVKSKIDDYFLRCKLASFDPNSKEALHTITPKIEEISPKNITECIDDIAGFPLSKIEADKALNLTNGINPAWAASISAFKEQIVDVLYKNKQEITEAEWNEISKKIGVYAAWQADKKGEEVEPLGIELIRELLANNKKEALFSLISEDESVKEEVNNIFKVDKLLHFQRDLFIILKNFVTFHDFYSPNAYAIFQSGCLYLDQRSSEMCVAVEDVDAHSAMAGKSGMYLIYCLCTSKVLGQTKTIVVGLTDGDVDDMFIGRNGVFYDRNGHDWDATIIKIIDNPISIRQAFWSPYKKVARFIEEQANKFAKSKDDKITSEATSKIEQSATEAESKDLTQPSTTDATKAQPFDIGKFVGIFAAIGMALGAIGSVLAAFISGFLGLTWWKMPLAVLGIILVISGPSMFIAWLKIRKRNIAPILDANGWAINARVLVNSRFGKTLTSLARLPKNSKLDVKDPFAAKTTPVWLKAIYILVIAAVIATVAWRLGYLDTWL